MRSSYLSISDLRYSYKQFSLGPISFDAAGGSVIGLIGPNGAGKTTLLSCIAGVLEGSSGSVICHESTATDLERRRRIAFASARNIWYKDLTFAEHLAFLRSYYPQWEESRAVSLASRLRLPLDKKTDQASAGMLAKLALVVALARGAKTLLFDEPWNALDPSARVEFTQQLQAVAREFQMAVIVSSHELANVEQICDSYLFLKDGQLVASGEKQALLRAAQLPDSASLLDVYLNMTSSTALGDF